ncbi:sensor histidine kinase [Streptacidiphilus sp. PB12-B1b]|uniref:sensor histidine kinase n=1 Tax=Streptacidiphilus sp. PB12-B1b TaxID=2705012 RepID=UPI0015FC3204|nr:histidine kinase [Streptacidiphilus sp. PB12-B1b]QMU75032.1 sensor histidine kinase [Streptacidiphilus sp. PB12-B1b]
MGAVDAVRRQTARRTTLADRLGVLLLFVLSVAASAMSARPSRHALPTLGSIHPATVVVAAIACGVLTAQCRRPRATVAVTVGCAIAYTLLGYGLEPVLLSPVLAALCGLALHTDRRTAWMGATAAAVVLVASQMVLAPGSWLEPQKLSVVAWTGMAAAAGDAVRSRRAYIAAIKERAERAERTREEEARRRVAEDRIRIARELHDVVAHHIALINAQAGVAVHLADEIPAPVRAALEHIRDSSHDALQELKATVGLLRQSEDPSAPLEPAPGLDQLPELLASFARAGLHVTLEQVGGVRPLPPAVDLTAYRIVQESLTNVSKHAAVPTARLQLYFDADRLAIRIEDDGRTAPLRSYPGHGHGTGHGLTGMRERAAVVGGTLTAGRDPWGGFRVAADLPLRPGGLQTPDTTNTTDALDAPDTPDTPAPIEADPSGTTPTAQPARPAGALRGAGA